MTSPDLHTLIDNLSLLAESSSAPIAPAAVSGEEIDAWLYGTSRR